MEKKFDKPRYYGRKQNEKKGTLQKADKAAATVDSAIEAAERALKLNAEKMKVNKTFNGLRDLSAPIEKIAPKQMPARQNEAAPERPANAQTAAEKPKRQNPQRRRPAGTAAPKAGNAPANAAPKTGGAHTNAAPQKAAGNRVLTEKIRNNRGNEKPVLRQSTEAAPRAKRIPVPKHYFKKFPPGTSVKIIPLGGIEEIGKNITVIEYENDIIIVDCGIAFPDDDMPGIDLVMPDITYLVKNHSKIRGIVLTHGHEDHIGSLPFFLKQINVPIYGTRLTLGILKNKLDEAGILNKSKLFQVEFGDAVQLGCFVAEFIRSSHSIADAAMIAIHTPEGVILHTGDFKIDNTPILGDPIDLARIAELGREGVLALISDSTNSERPGYTMSERKVGESFDNIFKNCEKRIVIATFASNIHRVQQIFDAAAKYGRKVAISGRSMENNIKTAVELGVLTCPPNVLIELTMINKYPPEKMVLITTGSQGETMSALYRMAFSDHKKVELGTGDLVVISASPIPGNEKLVSKVINELFKIGAEVIYESLADIHVSGHACKEEQKMIISLAKPKFFIPGHGEYRHLMKHAATAREMGIKHENIIIPQLGKIIELSRSGAKFGGIVPSGKVLVDGLGVGDVGNIVLRERRHLSEDGLVIVVATLQHGTNAIIAGPDIVSRGFIYVREAEQLMVEAKKVAEDVFFSCEQNGTKDWNNIKTNLKESLTAYIYSATKRRPLILPIIMEV